MPCAGRFTNASSATRVYDPQGPWRYAYEIRWLRRYSAPALPREIDGVPVKLVLVDEYPKAALRRNS